jgi:hypothetical protein
VLYAKGLAYVGDVFALCDFGDGGGGFPVVCHEEDGVGIFECGLEAILGVQIGLESRELVTGTGCRRRRRVGTYSDYFYAFLGEVLSSGLRGFASYAADLEFLRERGVGEELCDDGSALVARGTKDCDDFRHGGGIYRLFFFMCS